MFVLKCWLLPAFFYAGIYRHNPAFFLAVFAGIFKKAGIIVKNAGKCRVLPLNLILKYDFWIINEICPNFYKKYNYFFCRQKFILTKFQKKLWIDHFYLINFGQKASGIFRHLPAFAGIFQNAGIFIAATAGIF